MHLTMGVFGGAWVSSDAGPRRPRSPKQAAVLSLLMLAPGQPVSFESIADSLWPNQPFDEVRNSLRVHVSNLRKWMRDTASSAVADAVETLPHAYRLNVTPGRLDWVAFGELITDGQLALADDDAFRSIKLLQSALDLWADPFIELDSHDAVRAQRVLLAAQRELAEDELTDAQLRTGSAAEVVAVLEARALTYPYREHTHRQLMQALYATGRQADALDVYRQLYRTLRDDLGIEPGPQLKATQAAVLAQELVIAKREPATRSPVPLVAAARLAGRDSEVSTCLDAIERPGFVVVWGEAGAGKTRLLDEVENRASKASAAHRWIRCVAHQDQSTAPLWMIRDALGLDIDLQAGDVYDLNAAFLAELSRVPATVLLIDDFHWADEATIDFVMHLANSSRPGVTVVLALRSAAIDASGKSGNYATTLSRRPDATSLTLQPLSISDVTDLAEACGSPLPPSAVLERSGGNALYVTELLRSDQLLGTDADVPHGVSALLEERLSAVDATVAHVLSVAAVIGRQFETDLLIRVAGHTVEDVIDGVDAGRALGVVTTSVDGRPEFTHALIVDAFAARLTELERCRLHDKIAAALEPRILTSTFGPERAMHHAVASLPLGDPSRAVRLARQSGDASAARLAYADARNRYAAALAAADLLDDDTRNVLLPAITRELGSSAVGAGDLAGGQEQLRRAVVLATANGDQALAVRAAADLTVGPAPMSVADDETIRFVADAVEATTGDVTAERALMLAFLAAARYFTHDLAHCRDLADEALRIADLINDPRARSYARFGKWQTCLGPDEIDEQQRLSIEARSFAAASGSLAIVNSGYGMGTSTAFDLGDLAEGRRLNVEAFARLEGIDAPRFRWSAEGYDVLLKIADGRLDDAESAAHAVLDRSSRIGEGVSATNAVLTFGAQLVNIRLLQGRGSETVAILEGIDAGPAQLAYDAVRVAALAQANDARADGLITGLIANVAAARNDVLITTALAATADAAWSATVSGAGVDSDAAVRLAHRIEPLAHLHAHLNTFGTGGFYMGSLVHGLGQARAAAGDTDGAASAFDRAIAEHRRSGAQGFEARSIEARDRLG